MEEKNETNVPEDILVKPLTFFGKQAFSWAKAHTVGRKLLIAGPGRTGKSTFMTFLHTGELYPEKPTPHTGEDEPSAPLQIGYGKNHQATLNVKCIVDTVGLTEAHVVVSNVLKHRPHGLVIIVDCSTATTRDWVDKFFRRLGQRMSDSTYRAWRTRRKLKYILIMLNKADKVDNQGLLHDYQAKALNVAKEGLIAAGGTYSDRIEVFPTTLVDPPGTAAALKPVIATLCWNLR